MKNEKFAGEKKIRSSETISLLSLSRAIEFYRDSGGIPLSEALKKQHAESGFAYRGTFRFQRCCLLWLTCKKEGETNREKTQFVSFDFRIGSTNQRSNRFDARSRFNQ